MVKFCSVESCRRSANGVPSKHYFLLPQEGQLRQQWLAAAEHAQEYLPDHSAICERHFNEEDLIMFDLTSSNNPSVVKKQTFYNQDTRIFNEIDSLSAVRHTKSGFSIH